MTSATGSDSCRSSPSSLATGSTSLPLALSGVDLAAEVDERLDGLGHERARLLGVGEVVRPRLRSVLMPSTSTSTTQASPRSRARIVTTGRPYRLALRTKSSRGSGSAA